MPHDTPMDRPQEHKGVPGIVRLYVGMTVAPFAWAIHVLIGYSLAAYACYPKTLALDRPLWPGLRTVLVAVTAGCWVILAIGCFVAWRNWRATAHQSPASSHRMLQSGDGRARFMALCGLLVSGGFAIALLFTSVGVPWVPDCGP